MYKLLLLPVLFFSFLLEPDPDSRVEWHTPLEIDLGDILQHEPVTYDFVYKNISEEVLTIDNVRTSCSCTASNWQEEPPVEPDSIGHLKITYDAKKTGYFKKKIKVYFHNQKKGEKITLEGYVE